MNIKDKANKAYKTYNDFNKTKNGWFTGKESTTSERLHTTAINLAYKAIESGTPCIEIDYFL
jgi:hypothetical protein